MEHDHPATTTAPTVPMNLAENAPPNMENNDRPGDYIFTAYHEILSEDERGYPGTPHEYSWQDLLDIDPDRKEKEKTTQARPAWVLETQPYLKLKS